jgi:hypothetical protein
MITSKGLEFSLTWLETPYYEYFSLRWISNTSSTEDLVLVRSSDGGYTHLQKGYDEVVPGGSTPSSITTVTSQLSAAMTSGYQQAGVFWSDVFGGIGLNWR